MCFPWYSAGDRVKRPLPAEYQRKKASDSRENAKRTLFLSWTCFVIFCRGPRGVGAFTYGRLSSVDLVSRVDSAKVM